MVGPSLEIAIRLLTVGMASVFTILGLVALSSRALIIITNRITSIDRDNQSTNTRISDTEEKITSEEMAAIVSAVHVITEGRGHIHSISNKGT